METIESFNKKRDSEIIFTVFIQITYILLALLVYKYFNKKDDLIFWLIGGYGIVFLVNYYRISKLQKYYKYNILKPLIEQRGLNYSPDDGISLEYVDMSGLITENYDDYKSYDLIKGNGFMFSYLNLTKEEKKTVTDEKGKSITYTQTVTLFEGIFFVGKWPEKTKGFYLLKENEFHLSDIMPIFTDKERIKLDMPDFEKVFDVYGSDQIEGRYIFDFTFMQNILTLYKRLRFSKLAIKNGLFFILFPGISINIPLFKNVKKSISENLHLILFLSEVNEILFRKQNKIYISKGK